MRLLRAKVRLFFSLRLFFVATVFPASSRLYLRPSHSGRNFFKKCVWKIRDGKHLSPGCPGFFKAFYYFIIFCLEKIGSQPHTRLNYRGCYHQGGRLSSSGFIKKWKVYYYFFKHWQSDTCIC